MSHHYDSLLQTILPGSFPKVPWFDTNDFTLLSSFQNDTCSLAPDIFWLFLLADQ